MNIVARIKSHLQKNSKNKELKRKDLFNFLLDLDVVNLDEILINIKDMMSSGYYKKLIEAVSKDKFENDIGFFGNFPQSKVEMLACDNLGNNNPLKNILSKSIINVEDVIVMYSFIESVYYIYKNSLEMDDIFNIYFSGLDERLILGLDNFNEIRLEDLGEITPEYFQALGKVYWKDKKLYETLNSVMSNVMDLVLDYNIITDWPITYRNSENLFIKFLAACNAVNNGRLGIGAEDVVKAYKTFFKLIKTDVTKFKAHPEIIRDINNANYLFCNECETYYQIPSDESVNDYCDTCKCGEKLKYFFV